MFVIFPCSLMLYIFSMWNFTYLTYLLIKLIFITIPQRAFLFDHFNQIFSERNSNLSPNSTHNSLLIATASKWCHWLTKHSYLSLISVCTWLLETNQCWSLMFIHMHMAKCCSYASIVYTHDQFVHSLYAWASAEGKIFRNKRIYAAG